MYSQIHTQIIYHYFGSSFSQKQNIKKGFSFNFQIILFSLKRYIIFILCHMTIKRAYPLEQYFPLCKRSTVFSITAMVVIGFM